jgi:hypothetical protein
VSSTALRAKGKRRNEVVAKRAQAPAELPWKRPKKDVPTAAEPARATEIERLPDIEPAQGS